jgi:hypothetical protein
MIARAEPAVHVYRGPTITAAEVLKIVPGADIHPPVRHGDLLRLDVGPGDTVVIIDGVFHSVPAVRHKEILELLARGVRVIGASSMGALRAAELHRYGMTGVGTIFAAYRDGIINADDEVAVAHTDDHRPLSEALVDIRALAASAAADGILDSGEADRVVQHARSVHYVNRTWTALRKAASADPGLQALLQRLDSWRAASGRDESAKHADAVAALSLAAGRERAGYPVASSWVSSQWRTFYLRDWIARYHGCTRDGIHVPYLAIVQHQQLHDPGFPQRWRQHVLSWIADAAGTTTSGDELDVTGRALAAAEASGLALRHLSGAQLGYWLTGDEIANLDGSEKLARLLVRSVSVDATAAIWPTTAAEAPGLLDSAIDSAAAVIAAFRRNAEVSRSGPGRTVQELKIGVLRGHLARLWDVDPRDISALTAAARDRGFYGTSGAVSAARLFLLSASMPSSARTVRTREEVISLEHHTDRRPDRGRRPVRPRSGF